MSKLTIQHEDREVVPSYINGKARPLASERFFEVINAISGKVVHYAQSASVDDANAACDAAAAAFPAWSGLGYWERRNILLKAADLMESSAKEIGGMHELETSATHTYGLFGPAVAAYIIREMAAQLSTAIKGETMSHGDTRAMVLKQAVGPVLIIPPWNSPSILGPRSFATALAAGCTIVLKASELCPLVYRILVDVFERAGIPSGVINQIQVRREEAGEVTEALLAHPAIKKVEFIGSAKIGKIIGQIAAKYTKPIIMELGGKTPAIVLKDANLEMAVKNIAFGAFCHHGQICFSTERIIVVREVADKFICLLKQEVASKYANGYGSAATKGFALASQAIVQDAKDDGAGFLIGDNSLVGPNKTTLTPTILVGVKRASLLADEESFGPSASLYIVDTVDEAVEMANDTAYGLTATVWTEQDGSLAFDIASRLNYGVVHINACSVTDLPITPVQGWNGSGWGSSNAGYAISEFLNTKNITVRPATSPIQFQA